MRITRAHLLLLTTALVTGPALARTPVLINPSDVQGGHFYGSISGDYASAPRSPLGYLETCDMLNSGGDCSNDNTIAPFLVSNEHVNEWGGGATIGYGLSPHAGGGQPRIEFGFNYLTGDQTAGRSALLSGNNPFVPGVSKNLILVGIDGGSFQRCGNLANVPPACSGDRHMAFYNNDDYLDVDASIRTKQEEANFALRYLVDYDGGSGTTFTPFAGVVGGVLRTTFNAKASWFDSSFYPSGHDDTVLSSLYERVQTDYYGVEWGAQLVYDVTDRVKLFGAVQAAVLHQSAKLTGHDCLSREYGGSDPGPVPPKCIWSPTDPANEDGFATSASDRDSSWKPAFALSAGVSFEVWQGVNLGVTGFASYDTTYHVVNPGGTSSDDFLPMAPAHLDQVQRWTPGAQITLSFAL